jgi:hypothetical protein
MTAKSNGHNENAASTSSPPLPDSLQSTILITYRSVGLGVYGALMRFAGMPLEKIALYMNSSQVSGNNQLRQAIQLTFQDGQRGKSFLTPYKVVGPASGVAWFLQYSVMGKKRHLELEQIRNKIKSIKRKLYHTIIFILSFMIQHSYKIWSCFVLVIANCETNEITKLYFI